jgi:hypothetical protein
VAVSIITFCLGKIEPAIVVHSCDCSFDYSLSLCIRISNTYVSYGRVGKGDQC